MVQPLELMRSTAFWSLDALQGGKVRSAYRNLRQIDAADSDSEIVCTHRRNALDKLLEHATSTTAYYGKLTGKAFEDFPVINKNVIWDHRADFLSRAYSGKKLFTMTTSGSTGVPFVCVQDIGKKRQLRAEIIHYSEKAGYRLGRNLIFMRFLAEETKKSKLAQVLQNETLLNARYLEDDDIAKMLRAMREASRHGSTVLSYASTLDTLKDYFSRKGTSEAEGIPINGVVSGAQMLLNDTRQAITKAFHCKCYSRYSNQENGVIGQDCDEPNVFIINEASYIVEIFRRDVDEPAEAGEVGRIILTDLYNYALPFIRYDTGDLGALTTVRVNGIRKKAITNFGGRCVDEIYDCYGKCIRPGTLEMGLASFDGLRQYHVIQEGRATYTIEINVAENFQKDREFHAAMQEIFGPEARIQIVKVDGIPLLGSGKRKYLENRMKGA